MLDLFPALAFLTFVIFGIYKNSKTTESLMDLNTKTRNLWTKEQEAYSLYRVLAGRMLQEQSALYLTHPESTVREFATAILKNQDKQYIEQLIANQNQQSPVWERL